jgi:hypothetical protein
VRKTAQKSRGELPLPGSQITIRSQGVGAYEQGLYRFKKAMPLNIVDFANNDYVQFWLPETI